MPIRDSRNFRITNSDQTVQKVLGLFKIKLIFNPRWKDKAPRNIARNAGPRTQNGVPQKGDGGEPIRSVRPPEAEFGDGFFTFGSPS